MTISWIGAHPNNYASGRGGKQIDLVVMHWMAGRLAATDATFNDGRRQASATYGIEDKTIHQYVKEQDTSYNCGNYDANQRSISIEHSGGPDLPISEETYQTSIELVADVCKRYSIPLDRDHIKKHSDFKATACPGDLDVDRIIREAKKLVEAPPDQDLDRALAVLTAYKVENNHGNLEGSVNDLVGKARDLKDKVIEVESLKTDLRDRDGHIQELNKIIDSMKKQMDDLFFELGVSEIEDAMGKIVKLKSIKDELETARRVIEGKDKEIAQLKLTEDPISKFEFLGLLIKIYKKEVTTT